MGRSKEIAFVGSGQMGDALIRGLLEAGFCKAEQIIASDVRQERLEEMRGRYGIEVTSHNAELPVESQTLILAVKPQDISSVLSEVKPLVGEGHLVISIAAGVPVSYLEARLNEGARVIRVMPNMPCLLKVGCSALSRGRFATREDMDRAKTMFRSVGEVVEVEEKWMDLVTGLSGSGPAYVFLFAEALMEAGVRLGLSRAVARTLVCHTLKGASEMLLASEAHPAELKDRVSSPGGTTLAGLAELEKGAFRWLLLQAVDKAAQRSRELAQAL